MWGGYPAVTPPAKKQEPKCDECRRVRAILERGRDLPLPERVSYVYVGLIREALEGDKP